MNDTTTPVIENLNVREATIELRADMQLAGIQVTVSGTYNVDSNCFYPYSVYDHGANEKYDLEEYCEIRGWDYYNAHDEIQEAVEKRDA